MKYNKIGSVPYTQYDFRIIPTYPLCNKRKQAIALLPILSGKHRARHVFTPVHTEVIQRI